VFVYSVGVMSLYMCACHGKLLSADVAVCVCMLANRANKRTLRRPKVTS